MSELSRRSFLSASALGMAAAPVAMRAALAQDKPVPPSEKVRVGVVGCGGISEADMQCFLLNPEVDIPIICDIDDSHIANRAKLVEAKRGKLPDTVKDFRRVIDRKDVDVVLVCTPDHWHALPTIYACEAGKDVYCEKPLGKTIDEGRAMLEAAKKYNRVVQMGTHWRSGEHYRDAVEFVRSGKLGKVRMVRAWAYLDWLGGIGNPPDGPVPDGVDYDMWLGPAPLRPFNPNRFHFNFRWFWDYAGGLMTDWGVHLINMMLMGTGQDSPKTVFSTGGKYVFDDNSETPDSQVTVYEFPTYTLIWEHKAGLNNGLNGRSWGVEWSGTEGNIILNDGGYQLTTEPKRANLDSVKKPGSGDPRPAHVRNVLDCLTTRQQPVLNLEVGHHVSTVAHLGNIAYRTGRKIVWDSANEKVVGDPQADKLVGVKYRKPWKLPYGKREA